MTDYGLDIAVIGNGRTAALVNPDARILWWCLPRYDGDPVFCRLLSGDEEKGFTDVVLDDQVETTSDYVRNTAIVVTELTDSKGGKVRVTDFAPRFQNYGCTFRPPQLVRIIEPIAGMPRITIRFRVTHRYGVPVEQRSTGSNHIGGSPSPSTGRTRSSAPPSRSSCAISRKPARSSRRSPRRSRKDRDRDAPGIIAIAGCAMRSSSSAR